MRIYSVDRHSHHSLSTSPFLQRCTQTRVPIHPYTHTPMHLLPMHLYTTLPLQPRGPTYVTTANHSHHPINASESCMSANTTCCGLPLCDTYPCALTPKWQALKAAVGSYGEHASRPCFGWQFIYLTFVRHHTATWLPRLLLLLPCPSCPICPVISPLLLPFAPPSHVLLCTVESPTP